MLYRPVKYFCIIFILSVLPAAALHASANSDARLREAVLQADQLPQTEAKVAAAEIAYEADLVDWRENRDTPIMSLEEPVPPAPGHMPEPEREAAALPAAGLTSPARNTALTRDDPAIIFPELKPKTSVGTSDAHVPSAYLRYLSLRFHAGPPAKV